MKRRIIEIVTYVFLIGLVVGFLFVHLNQTRKNIPGDSFEIFCDFESIDSTGNFITTSPAVTIPKFKASTKYFCNGKQSMVVPDYAEYYGLTVLPDISGPSNITCELLRKKGSNAYIAVQGINNKSFYSDSRIPEKVVNGEWELLSLTVITDINFRDSISVYICNPDKQTTYIDDFRITVKYGAYYPVYKEEPLLIYINKPELQKLEQKRKDALSRGILITEDDSWVKALVFGDNKMMHAEVRLKGDWLDHLIGDKISLRIKLVDGSWRGMRVFSIQNPYTRGFTNEWIIHQTCKEEDILTTRYDFVPVYINGRSLGIYAYEEHFQKELIESSLRREGPIVKFSENDFWDYMKVGFTKGFAYETSVIEPFSEGKIMNDSVQYNHFVNAENLLHIFRELDAKASDIFDVKKTAKFIAFLNSRNSIHALEWHNMRFYYNPVLCRLEPVVFDVFAGPSEYNNYKPITTFLESLSLDTRTNSFYYLMADSIFKEEYFKQIDLFTNSRDFNYYKEKFSREYADRDSLIRIEYKPYYRDVAQFDRIKTRLELMLADFRDSLSKPSYVKRIEELNVIKFNTSWPKNPELYADKYVKCFKNGKNKVFIRVYFNGDFIITGIGSADKIVESLNINVDRPDDNRVFEKEISVNDFSDQDNFVYFRLPDKDTLFKTKIYPWQAPVSYNPRNDIASKSVDLGKYTDLKTKTITFEGNLEFNNHIYIPSGYKVIFKPGTSINIKNKSAFISCSPVYIDGTKDKPVKIYSSDKTAMGFTVLQAESKSIVKYGEFRDFNTINYHGWLLTGAVTFYESDVDIYNTLFTNNHCEDMLNTVRSKFYLKDCVIQNTFGDSHDSDFCTGTLDNCTFLNNGNDAIDFSTSKVNILNCKIDKAADKGISLGEHTNAVIKNVTVSNVNIGVASKDLSDAHIDKISISNSTYGFVLLQKKPEFGPATITADNCKLENTVTESLIEKGSVLVLNGKTFNGKKPKLYALFYE